MIASGWAEILAYEPFSNSTRRAKSTLLLLSVASFSVAVFDISLVNVPGVGFDIEMAQGFLPTIVGIGTGYALITFLLYASKDLNYIRAPEGISDVREEIKERMLEIVEYQTRIQSAHNTYRKTSQDMDEEEFELIRKHLAEMLRPFFNDKSTRKRKKIVRRFNGVNDFNKPKIVRLSMALNVLREFYRREFSIGYLHFTTRLRVCIYDTALPLLFGIASLGLLAFPEVVRNAS